MRPIQLSEKMISLETPPKSIMETMGISLERGIPGILQEAVFNDGRATVQPIIDLFQSIKDQLESGIKEDPKKFDSAKFYKNKTFTELENTLQKIFGFRIVVIHSTKEKYDHTTGKFGDGSFNCYTFIPEYRYPVDGLVSDKGFYDESHTIRLEIIFSIEMIRVCTAEELTAVLLHEIAHNIDPALVDISYTKINVLSKYLTDRKGSISEKEKSILNKTMRNRFGIAGEVISLGIILSMISISIIIDFIKNLIKNPLKIIDSIKKMIKRDGHLDRTVNAEMFADNFARMYGLAAPLMSGIQKLADEHEEYINSLVKREKVRQELMMDMITSQMKTEHKTNIHRIHNLISEYEKDMKDPKIPTAVRKSMKDDMDELIRILKEYTENKDAFKAKVYTEIYNSLKELDPSIKANK